MPAFNEERALPHALSQLDLARARLPEGAVEICVVDNRSTDRTSAIAEGAGACVISEPKVGIANARNAGAHAARGRLLVFIDADATYDDVLLERIDHTMKDERCAGGAADGPYEPANKRLVRWYLAFWRIIGRILRMSQGTVQFCRDEAFRAIGGYAPGQYMGEDVDFIWRLRRQAKRNGQRVVILTGVGVRQSARRFDGGRCGARSSGRTRSSSRRCGAARSPGAAGTSAPHARRNDELGRSGLSCTPCSVSTARTNVPDRPAWCVWRHGARTRPLAVSTSASA
jgi:glycosyltransferase involved in cell wall biosynthesis